MDSYRRRTSSLAREEDAMHYQLAYSIGFHPWEDAATDQPFVDKITSLFAREETGRERPFGPALDLGTGSGIWAVELAKRGWQVTGVELVDKALSRARDRVAQEGVDVRLVHGDVTDLRAAGIGSGYRLIVDSGTFHDFDTERQRAMGREVTAVAAADATLLLIAWPRRRRPLIRGADRSEIEQAFPDWTITDVEPSHFTLPRLMEAVLRPDEQWYRLRRKH
ncbi:class I SAM-dependent methyltransferase [Lentzea alba]|uniref:class I SAM-dependent methyltransferase n=1 Tax=Lentzea alba TaxID=2714351 RepID=UPI0039BF1ED3